MQKVWNIATRAYDYVQEGVLVDGQDYTIKPALEKWAQRNGAARCRKAMARQVIQGMIDRRDSFSKHHEWLEAIEEGVVLANNALIYPVRGKTGQSGTITWASIPLQYRAALLDIANGQGQAWSRGPHNTTPAKEQASVRDPKEYHLTNAQDGRATTGMQGGTMFIYYSTTHSFATYNYHLVTFPFRINNMANTVEVPLMGGPRDTLIVLPT